MTTFWRVMASVFAFFMGADVAFHEWAYAAIELMFIICAIWLSFGYSEDDDEA